MRIFSKLFSSVNHKRENKLAPKEEPVMDLVREFMEASQKDDLPTLSKLLEKDQTLIHARNEDGFTALHIASFHGSLRAVQHLLEKGADPNAKGSRYGRPTPIERCYCDIANEDAGCYEKLGRHSGNSIQIAALLLKRGADPNPIIPYACWNCDTEMVTLLINNGADINLRFNMENTPLLRLIDNIEANWSDISRAKELLLILVSNGADIHLRDSAYRMTALERLRAYLAKHCENRHYQTDARLKEWALHKGQVLKDMIQFLEGQSEKHNLIHKQGAE